MARLISKIHLKGDKNYQGFKVYSINVLDFKEPMLQTPDYLTVLRFQNEKSSVFFKNLLMVYIEMPKFAAPFEQCESRLEQWITLLKNPNLLMENPAIAADPIFSQLLERCQTSKLTPMEKKRYNEDILQYQDVKDACEFHKEEGMKEGMEKGMREGIEQVCKSMIALKYSDEDIAAVTHLSEDYIKSLRKA